jgi:hypothetical protein
MNVMVRSKERKGKGGGGNRRGGIIKSQSSNKIMRLVIYYDEKPANLSRFLSSLGRGPLAFVQGDPLQPAARGFIL